MRWLVPGLWLVLVAGCNEESSMGGGGGGGGGGSGSAAAKPTSAGGGFSADLAKELAGASGSGKTAGSGAMVAAADPKAGSGDAKAGDPKAGSAEPMAGSADPKAGDPKAGSGDAKAGDPKAGDPKTGDPKAGDPKAGDPKAGDPKAGDPPPPDPTPKVGTGPGPVIQQSGTAPKKVTVPPELAAIKFGMLPNWERDVQDAGTISLGVKIPGRGDSAVFVFRYGYEDASAPADRDAYKKWLADKRLITSRQDRQAGAAWFLEGVDGSGNAAFRVVVNWGGRKLICYGSLYRDAESSRLGDLRDQTIIQAKQICETIAL